jgi:DNA mismatch repair protein MutS
MTNPVRDAAGERRSPVPPPADHSPPGSNTIAPQDDPPGGAGGDSPIGSSARGTPRRFTSLLFDESSQNAADAGQEDRSFASDLNVDQIIRSVAGDREEHDLVTTVLYRQLHDTDTVDYRHDVFRDFEDPSLHEQIHHFADLMRQVRAHLVQVQKVQYQRQGEGWFLDAAAIYCDAVRSLVEDLSSAELNSRALLAFRDFLTAYVASASFISLSADTRELKDGLAQVRYCTRIRGGKVDVTRYEGEADYSAEVLTTFDRFKQGAVKDYRVKYRTWPGMNHVGAQIIQLVARLLPEEFAALTEFCRQHSAFVDDTIRRFERELQFYLSYLDYIQPLRSAGLTFCYPEVSSISKDISATDTFDLALANKLIASGKTVVCNEFHLEGPERIIVVSGPNQGGKTTFARMFGQLHHLASVGCPVPGSSARLFLFDRLFTHFERDEDLTKMSGKLEDDLVRIKQVLQAATTSSIVIMNETFTSTTLNDARFLGGKVMEKIIRLGLLSVYVTFIDELALFGGSVVSMVSTIVPENPAERTYRVVRAPADGLAYALAIAEKYNLTYDRLQARVMS